MENYATILIKSKESLETTKVYLEQNILSDISSNVEEIKNNGTMVELSILGGASTENDVEIIMEKLNENDFELVKGYVTGDEDPWCSLYWISDNQILSEDLDGGIYEYIADCDESDLDDYDGLREAKDKGPEQYFNEKFNYWKQGLESCDLSSIRNEVERIIKSSSC
ncbi:MAG: hypothetical protein HWE27_16280 [Gammaproteobacteria bacterium]|nr:hypothetical protein [Gammaproteobacteria bacterium]